MRVLVTGGRGFVGSQVVALARAAGHEVLVADLVPGTGSGPDAAPVDVRDAIALRDQCAGVDAIVHLAAKVGLERDLSDAPDYLSHTGLGTAQVIAAAAAAHVTYIVLGSSMVVYGEGLAACPEHELVRPGPRRVADLEAGRFEPPCPLCGRALAPAFVTEDAPVDPRNVYAAAKLVQEHLVSAWARQSGGRAVALRFHNIFGPGAPVDNPYSGVASLFRSAVLRGDAPRVTEDGAQLRDFVHVRDVARACLRALEVMADGSGPWGPGQTRAYNIGSGTPRSIGEFARRLTDLAGTPEPVVTGAWRLGDVRHITASARRAEAELGWVAHEDLTASLGEFLADGVSAHA